MSTEHEAFVSHEMLRSSGLQKRTLMTVVLKRRGCWRGINDPSHHLLPLTGAGVLLLVRSKHRTRRFSGSRQVGPFFLVELLNGSSLPGGRRIPFQHWFQGLLLPPMSVRHRPTGSDCGQVIGGHGEKTRLRIFVRGIQFGRENVLEQDGSEKDDEDAATKEMT